jgi:hypothetical protein
MAEASVDALVQEIKDLLDVSRVGVYEFMDWLDEPDPDSAADTREAVARAALQRLLDEGGVEMHWTRWPGLDDLGAVSIADLPANPWRGPDDDNDGRYIALDRT